MAGTQGPGGHYCIHTTKTRPRAVSGKFALLALATLLSLMNQAGNVSVVKRQHTLSIGSVTAGHELCMTGSGG